MRNSTHLTLTVAVAAALAGCPTKKKTPTCADPPCVAPPGPLDVLGAPLPTDGPLMGWVDLHAHPMAHLGYGGKLLHGAPDLDVLMPRGMLWVPPMGCNSNGAVRPQTVADALGTCYATHGGPDLFDNQCGDQVTHDVIKGVESGAHSAHGPGVFGHEIFTQWPRHDDITHQFMWIDWVERAYLGGQRVMVALAVNSRTLAKALTDTHVSDRDVADLQIAEMRRMVEQHDWMQIAESSDDVKRIVGEGDLAIVLGVEIDEIGDFTTLYRANPMLPDDRMIREEIDRLYALGVRYVFPLHVVDNVFGGTAVYKDLFNVANRFQWGTYWDLECDDAYDYIHRAVDDPVEYDSLQTLKNVFGIIGQAAVGAVRLGIPPGEPRPIPVCGPGEGHRNRRGLTRRGRVAIRHMMSKGMIIDIDHGSRYTVDAILEMAARFEYPVVSGHSARVDHGGDESARTALDYETIGRLGGMAGVGYGTELDRSAHTFGRDVDAVLDAGAFAVALGTDANGLVTAPGTPVPPFFEADETRWPPATMRDSPRVWRYLVDGVAHYGLLPDFLKQARVTRPEAVGTLMNGAGAFAAMWKKAETFGPTVPQDVPLQAGGQTCDDHHDCASGLCNAVTSRCFSP